MSHGMEERTPDRLVRSTKFRNSCGASPPIDPDQTYQPGEIIGGLMEFTCATRWTGGSGFIETILVADKAKQMKALTLVLFGFEPIASTFTDGEPCRMSPLDLVRSAGAVRVKPEHWEAFEENALATVPDVALGFECQAHSLFGLLVVRETVQYASASDLYVLLTLEQD
jgi:hypothetical protein